jgi:hypothetical protein
MDVARKEALRTATRNACAAMTAGMSKAQLQARLAEVRSKVKSSTDMAGKPQRGMAERIRACNEEIARLEGLIAKAH